MKRVFLSLGSNLGDRSGNIRRALDEITAKGIEVLRISSFYRTEPVDFRPQPWFVNCVAEVLTALHPLQLMKTLQSVERGLGRRRAIRKGPRTIDIDILLYENVVIRTAELTVPHKSMAERRFVLVPLGELASGLRHPVVDQTVTQMLYATTDTSQVIRIEPQRVTAGT